MCNLGQSGRDGRAGHTTTRLVVIVGCSPFAGLGVCVFISPHRCVLIPPFWSCDAVTLLWCPKSMVDAFQRWAVGDKTTLRHLHVVDFCGGDNHPPYYSSFNRWQHGDCRIFTGCTGYTRQDGDSSVWERRESPVEIERETRERETSLGSVDWCRGMSSVPLCSSRCPLLFSIRPYLILRSCLKMSPSHANWCLGC